MNLFEIFNTFNKNEREFYEERAAIIEYDGNVDRLTAQKLAIERTIEFYRRKEQ